MIDYYTELTNRGMELFVSGETKHARYAMAVCPFHEDNDPSFSIGLHNGRYRCFGCEARGDFADLIAQLDNISVKEARKKLKRLDSMDGMLATVTRSLESQDEVVSFFSEKSFHKVYPPVTVDSKAYAYLVGKKRKFKVRMIKLYDMRVGVKGRYKYRVIIPIKTPVGKIVSYVGISYLKKPLVKTVKAKSPSVTLFGIYELLQQVKPKGKLEYIVLVEGESDAIYLQQYRVPAVANMGTSILNKHQIHILRKYAKRVVLSYDGDLAGIKAMYGDGKKRMGEFKVLSKWMPVITVDLPDGRDPNSLSVKEVLKYYRRFMWEHH